MGKKQHQKDKLYLTCSEWRHLYGGKKDASKEGDRSEFKRLPYFCCSLSLQPFEHPYCTAAGVIYDLVNIVPFIKQFGVNPVTGEKMLAKDLIKLSFHKNSNGKFHCPVTFKVFNENTHIVAVGSTGNVFSYEAVERLNIKVSFWKDLLNDEPFLRKEIITIQDPMDLTKFNLSSFFHLKKNLKVIDEEEEAAKKHPRYRLKATSKETNTILDELDSTYKAPEKKVDTRLKADAISAAHYSTGRAAASFTSTSITPDTHMEADIVNEDLLRYERIKKKAYVQIITNKGTINLELHSDQIPKACDNFLHHCISGYYKGTKFHRSIRNFMVQGGDPLGDGSGGESIWGKPFEDHFKPNLVHAGRGILSMANSGPNTNKSQFFITYRSARHLDNKHTVFGRVVGGLDTLYKIEMTETDKKDKPTTEIIFEDAVIFVNPYAEVDELLKKEREEALEKEQKSKESQKRKIKEVTISNEPKVFKKGVGKYINPAIQKQTFQHEDASETQKKKTTKKIKTGPLDFSGW